jgi:hypothetical protein
MLKMTGRIPGLDGIRGVAIALVLVEHLFRFPLVPGSLGIPNWGNSTGRPESAQLFPGLLSTAVLSNRADLRRRAADYSCSCDDGADFASGEL